MDNLLIIITFLFIFCLGMAVAKAWNGCSDKVVAQGEMLKEFKKLFPKKLSKAKNLTSPNQNTYSEIANYVAQQKQREKELIELNKLKKHNDEFKKSKKLIKKNSMYGLNGDNVFMRADDSSREQSYDISEDYSPPEPEGKYDAHSSYGRAQH